MKQTELNTLRTILSTKRADLARAAGKREGIVIERTADALDETVFAAERELTTRSLELNLALVRKIDAALGRISDGTYGVCMECEEEISQKRLNAMPWATLCIACQELADGSLFLKAA